MANRRTSERLSDIKLYQSVQSMNEKRHVCVCVCTVRSVMGMPYAKYVHPISYANLRTTQNPISWHVQIQQVQSQTNTPKGQIRAQSQIKHTPRKSQPIPISTIVCSISLICSFVCLKFDVFLQQRHKQNSNLNPNPNPNPNHLSCCLFIWK